MRDPLHFDKIFSNNYEFTYPFDQDLLNDILKYKKSGKVLDLGCGEGGLSIQLSKKDFEVHSLDISPTAIKNLSEYSQRNSLNIQTMTGDVRNLQDFKFKFDIIICNATLHFLTTKEATLFLSNISSILNPNGILLLNTFSKQDPTFEDPYFYPTVQEIKDIFKEKIIQLEEYDDYDKEEDQTNKLIYSIISI
jgi:2-polyprenyl-3-methyl-5-hydroxy-6-metoxy-1,4-benzoquinol methylase